MTDSMADRRLHPRLFLNNDEFFSAFIIDPKVNKTPFMAEIMNISCGGLQFCQSRENHNLLEPGNYLTLQKISKVAELSAVTGVCLEIMWIIDNEAMDHIATGCQFIEMPQPGFTQLNDYITQQLQSHNNKHETIPSSASS